MAIIDNPELYFQTKLYTGNSGTNAITFDGSENMQPDWVWLKRRDSGSNNHRLCDSVRGVNKQIYSSSNGAEGTSSGVVQSFDSNGFTLNTSDSSVNVGSYVCWNWKAGTSFTNDASGTGIGSIDSAGSFNNDAGFSIVTYTGTGSDGTIKHGLNSVPKIVFWKRLDNAAGAVNWIVQSTLVGNQTKLVLNTTEATSTNTSFSQTNNWTSALLDLKTYEGQNASSGTYVAYCFAEKTGFSKFSSYTGNGDADGTFVYTGFKPAFIMVKRSNGIENWTIMDTTRDPFNVAGNKLHPNTSGGTDAGATIDILSNGFKNRTTNAGANGSGDSYIYMAIAENPFVTSTGNGSIPATAR
jgi:hypothetical protein